MKKLILFYLLLVPLPRLHAQQNVVKVNISSVVLRNVYMSYERTLAKKLSFQMGINMVPSRKVPFSSNFSTLNGNESPMIKMKMSGWGITPELRLYTSFDKGSPKGFYIAPYMRFSQYTFHSKNYQYKYADTYDENKEKTSNVDFSGHATFIGGGVMIGHQWIIGKNLSVDFWILGVGISSANIDLKASSNTMDSRYFEKDSQFSEDITNNLKALNTVETSHGSNYVQANSNRTLPMLRGLGLNVGVAF